MEKQYIFFNTGKALSVFFIGMLALFILIGYLAFNVISNPYIVFFIVLLCSGVIILLSYKLDRM
jgi:hypothetical protein